MKEAASACGPAHETQRLCEYRRPRRRIRLAGAGQALRALEGLERVAGGRREAPVDLDRGIAGRALGERRPGFLDTGNVKSARVSRLIDVDDWQVRADSRTVAVRCRLQPVPVLLDDHDRLLCHLSSAACHSRLAADAVTAQIQP